MGRQVLLKFIDFLRALGIAGLIVGHPFDTGLSLAFL